jgi:DNA mismatch repair protein MutS2
VAATTHYAELKAYAHTAAGARNASVEFDLETLSPTYRLTIGLPGGSQAFAIAERLGLPDAIVEDARARLTDSQRAFEATLASIRKAEQETARALDQAREADRRAAEARRTAEDERRRSRAERDALRATARAEVDGLLVEFRTELAAAREALRRGHLSEAVLDQLEARLATVADRLPEAPPATASAASADAREWATGERARSRSGGWEGRVAAIDRAAGRATLEAGGLRVSVELADLEPAVVGPTPGVASVRQAAPGASVEALRLAKARSVPSSLDLRGARVEEAVAALERYLEDASLAGLKQVLVIHGLGTGALRDATRAAASAHPLVGSVRPGERGEGGDGATVVVLG